MFEEIDHINDAMNDSEYILSVENRLCKLEELARRIVEPDGGRYYSKIDLIKLHRILMESNLRTAKTRIEKLIDDGTLGLLNRR